MTQLTKILGQSHTPLLLLHMWRQNWNLCRLYRPFIWHSKTTSYVKGIHFCKDWIFRNLFLRIDAYWNKNFCGIFFGECYVQTKFCLIKGINKNNSENSVVRILSCFRVILELKYTFWLEFRMSVRKRPFIFFNN